MAKTGDYRQGSPLSGDEIRYLDRLLSDPLAYPAIFKNWLLAYLRDNLRGLPLSSVSNAGGLVDYGGPIVTREQILATGYGNLATVGPSITGLPSGVFVVSHGCALFINAGGVRAYQSVSINGGTPSDDNAVVSEQATLGPSGSFSFVASLQAESNDLLLQYRAANVAGAQFERRWLEAIRISTL